jgi:hypothetical protein
VEFLPQQFDVVVETTRKSQQVIALVFQHSSARLRAGAWGATLNVLPQVILRLSDR